MLTVLVTGSGSRYEVASNGDLVGGDKFIELCEALGRALAARKHQILLLSDDPAHADPHVLRGYLSEVDARELSDIPQILVTQGSTDDPENRSAWKFRHLRGRSPLIRFTDVNVAGEYPFNRVAIVRRANGMVAIGGAEGVRQLMEIAEALDTPLVPVPAFGGVAQEAWFRRELLFSKVLRASTEPLTQYFGHINEERAVGIVTVLESLAGLKKGWSSAQRSGPIRAKPKVFIGSSSEGLSIANKLQELLSPACSSVVWNQGTVFGLGTSTFEALEDATADYDAGIFIFTPDDELHSRGNTKNVARDNVLFELGLFAGKLGRRRAVVVNPAGGRISLPTDLAGITTATYDASEPDLAARLGPVATTIRRALLEKPGA